MGERYWITGVELGMLISYKNKADRERVVNNIVDEQFIANFLTDGEKEWFKKEIDDLANKARKQNLGKKQEVGKNARG